MLLIKIYPSFEIKKDKLRSDLESIFLLIFTWCHKRNLFFLFYWFANFTFSLPLQIGVALYLLYTQVSYAFLSGLAITILLIPGIVNYISWIFIEIVLKSIHCKFAFRIYLIIAFLCAVNKWISTLIARATEGMMKQKDER